MLTAPQAQLLRFIDTTIKATGVCPSFAEMAEAGGYSRNSKSTIHRLLISLEERGFVARRKNHWRAIEVVRMPVSADPLVAAAPDLLAACRAAKDLLINDLEEPGRTVFWRLVEAINKAEGKSL